ncbi:hypothetical protein GCM10025875_34210 [Litorihabitans aurantiacus]|uniref:PdxS/SNZ N-terminal domain-containing protein n=1 Tax=Litorihabitans aurantiacus TaxID=1930061 RepID=A0AA38CVK2_9MICO|nr:hypothetical protein GCM10025875_34210 [Litorihabitans aurantiacus]
MADILTGIVNMSVFTAERAGILGDAGAVAVMAMERVPAEIRAEGGVLRMSDPNMTDEIIATISIAGIATARIGHFARRIWCSASTSTSLRC